MTRMVSGRGPVSSLICSNGLMGVSSSNCLMLAYSSGVNPQSVLLPAGAALMASSLANFTRIRTPSRRRYFSTSELETNGLNLLLRSSCEDRGENHSPWDGVPALHQTFLRSVRRLPESVDCGEARCGFGRADFAHSVSTGITAALPRPPSVSTRPRPPRPRFRWLSPLPRESTLTGASPPRGSGRPPPPRRRRRRRRRGVDHHLLHPRDCLRPLVTGVGD